MIALKKRVKKVCCSGMVLIYNEYMIRYNANVSLVIHYFSNRKLNLSAFSTGNLITLSEINLLPYISENLF